MSRYNLSIPIAMPFAGQNFNVVFNNSGALSSETATLLESVTQGCRLLHWSQLFDEPAKQPIVHNREFLALCFNLGDPIRYNIYGLPAGMMRKNRYNLVYIPGGELEFEKGAYTTLCIQLTPFFLNTYSEDFSLKDFLQKVAQKKPAIASTGHLPITPAMKESINLILMNRYTGGYRDHFINRHSMDVLFDCLRHIQGYSIPFNTRFDVNVNADIQYAKQIKRAWEYLCDNLRNQIVIADLELLTGLNKAKLEKGFKIMYGATIFTVLLEERMKMAKKLLRDSSMTIRQIAYEVGFKNLSNFSESFKKRFKYAPSEWRGECIEGMEERTKGEFGQHRKINGNLAH